MGSKDENPNLHQLMEGDWTKAVLDLSRKEGSIKALIPLLAEKDEKKRWRIVLAIVRIAESAKNPAVKELLNALKVPEFRENAEKCLSLIADPRIKRPWVVDALLEALEDESELVRAKAAELLGEIGDTKAIKPLIKALADEGAREKAAWALAFTGKRCTSELVEALETSDPRVRDTITEIIVKIGEDATEALIPALESELWFVRKNAAYALGEILRGKAKKSKKALPRLLKLLDDEDLEVREAAKKALKKIQSEFNPSS